MSRTGNTQSSGSGAGTGSGNGSGSGSGSTNTGGGGGTRPKRVAHVKRHALTFVLWSLIAVMTAVVSLTLGLGAMGGAHHVAYAMHAPAVTTWCTAGQVCHRAALTPAGNHVGVMSAALYVVLAVAFVVMTTSVAWVTPRRRGGWTA